LSGVIHNFAFDYYVYISMSDRINCQFLKTLENIMITLYS